MTHDDIISATRIWLEKAVIGLNLCPFAKAVYVKNQVRIVVSEARHLDALLELLDDELLYLANVDPEQTDTTLIVIPDLLPDFIDFNDFVGLAEDAVADNGLEGVLQIANFHPQFQFADTQPDDISNYTNRAPFPTLHLIRESSIDRAVAAFPEAEEIFDRNIALMNEMGIDGWNALGIPGLDGKQSKA
ncbi:DUF1415 domain-containing protein [Burkholderiaceae bacterium DAT-1]|nr:DUF1415 domain-containing protein [Burkholderiaceae bacterium DAT-1]